MELILTELVSLIIVSIIVLADRSKYRIASDVTDNHIIKIAYIYILYLSVSIVSHVHMKEIFDYGIFASRIILILHTVSIPVFIFVWMTTIEHSLLKAKQYRTLLHVQAVVLLLFLVVSFFDLYFGKLYLFSDSGMLLGGVGIDAMLIIGGIYGWIAMAVVIAKWKTIDHSIRILYILSSAFIQLSLLFFHVFKEPTLFALSSSFNLLLIYLFHQRKEISLDPLTRVPNRTLFLERLKQYVHKKQQATLILFDIENFRLINARYTNTNADLLLWHFATFLSESWENHEVFRLVGNRFLLSFPPLQHNQIVRVVKEVKARCAEGWEVKEHLISFFVNTAIVQLPLNHNSVEEIIESLDFTLYEIKEKRKHSAIIFNQKLINVRQRRLDVLSAIKETIHNPFHMMVYYQPIIDISDNSIIGAEALMRLENEQLGLISPGEFIPAAEQSGLISYLTVIMVEKVCSFISEFKAHTTHLSHISINISATDLGSSEVVQKLLTIFEKADIDTQKIGFEVTETMLIESKESVYSSWNAFKEKGIHFLLDDFGTGYSNLQTVVNLPFETIKIDRSVVSNENNDYELMTLLSDMLKKLGKQMVAEGVETKQQLQAVRDNGIRYVQGYYFSKPIPEQEFLDYITGAMCILPSVKK